MSPFPTPERIPAVSKASSEIDPVRNRVAPQEPTSTVVDNTDSTNAILSPEGHMQNEVPLRGGLGVSKLKQYVFEQYGAFNRAMVRIVAGVVFTLLCISQRIAGWTYISVFLSGKQETQGVGHADDNPRVAQPKLAGNMPRQADHNTTAGGTQSLDTPASDSYENWRKTNKRSRIPVSRRRLIDGDLNRGRIRLDINADFAPEPSTRPTQETAKSNNNIVRLKDLLENNIRHGDLLFRMPTDRPTLILQEEIERQRQCIAEFMDWTGQWHFCHVLFDTWCDRDVISTALIQPLIHQRKFREWLVPEEAVETLQNVLGSHPYALKSYVLVSGFRFEHRRTKVIGIKELYLIPNETPFIILSPTSMEKHGIHLSDFPKDEGGSYLKFSNPQCNAGVVKFKKGKDTSKEDQKHQERSRAKHADIERKIEEDRNAEASSSAETETTWSEKTKWSDPTKTSQNSSSSSGQ